MMRMRKNKTGLYCTKVATKSIPRTIGVHQSRFTVIHRNDYIYNCKSVMKVDCNRPEVIHGETINTSCVRIGKRKFFLFALEGAAK